MKRLISLLLTMLLLMSMMMSALAAGGETQTGSSLIEQTGGDREIFSEPAETAPAKPDVAENAPAEDEHTATESLVTETPASGEKDAGHAPICGYYINPLYADILSIDDLRMPEPGQSASVTVNSTEEIPSVEENGIALRQAMKNREESFTCIVEAPEYTWDYAKEIEEIALQHTGDPTEGDYIRWQYGGFYRSMSFEYYTDDGVVFSIMYTLTYYTTSAQEQELTAVLSEVMSSLNLDEKEDYDKIKAIYDYICANVRYDYDHLNSEHYDSDAKCINKLPHSAYAALVNKTAVCQGYAVLLYRMALEAGIDCRIITGTGNGGGHAWNIVKLGDVYYNMDSTWDEGRLNYRYFLKGSGNFLDHVRDKAYTTADWNLYYPMSATDYERKDTSGDVDISDLHWSLETLDGQTIDQDSVQGKYVLFAFYNGSLDNGTGHPCGMCVSLIQQLAGASWITQDNIQVIAVDMHGNTAESVKTFTNLYAPDCEDIVFALNGHSLGWKLARRAGIGNDGSLTYGVCFVVKDNKVLAAWEGETEAMPCRNALEQAGAFDMMDINRDSNITLMDATLLFNYVTGFSEETVDKAVGDLNGDGNVTLIDVTLLFNFIAGF